MLYNYHYLVYGRIMRVVVVGCLYQLAVSKALSEKWKQRAFLYCSASTLTRSSIGSGLCA